MPRDLSFHDLAEITGRHPETLRQLARRGRLPGSYKLGGRWAISREAADLLRNVRAERRQAEEGGEPL